jgi:hypothetical protein
LWGRTELFRAGFVAWCRSSGSWGGSGGTGGRGGTGGCSRGRGSTGDSGCGSTNVGNRGDVRSTLLQSVVFMPGRRTFCATSG